MFQNILVPLRPGSAEFTQAEQLTVENAAIPFPWIIDQQAPCQFNATIDQAAGVFIRGNHVNGITTTDDSYFSGKIVKFKGKIVITHIGYSQLN